MSVIRSIGVENFKLFKDKTDFKLAPITVLTGTNSSGKSSVVQVIRLLANIGKILNPKQMESNVWVFDNPIATISSLFFDLDLNVLGDRIGDFAKLITKGSKSSSIKIAIQIENRLLGTLEIRLVYTLSGSLNYGKLVSITVTHIATKCVITEYLSHNSNNVDFDKTSIMHINFKDLWPIFKQHLKHNPIVHKRKDEKGEWFIEREYCLDNTLYDYWDILKAKEGAFDAIQNLITDNIKSLTTKEEINENFEELLLGYLGKYYTWCSGDKVVGEGGDNYLIKYDPYSYKSNPLKYVAEFPPEAYPVVSQHSSIHTQSLSIFTTDRFNEVSSFIKNYFSDDLDLIRPTNAGEMYFLIFPDSHGILNPLVALGTTQFLSSFRTKSTRIQKMLDGSDLGSIVHQVLAENVLESQRALKFLQKYLRAFKIADDVFIRKDDEGYQFKLYVRQGEEEFLLADVGYGYSQLLPILLTIARLSARKFEHQQEPEPITLVIEEPEANLHPALQSKLADLFYEAHQQFNIQFIVETHSEYLIRRLQVMTADPNCEMKPEDTQIHYFYHPDDIPEGEPQVYPINIQEDGALSKNFGKGFFDESSNLNVALYNFTRNNYN